MYTEICFFFELVYSADFTTYHVGGWCDISLILSCVGCCQISALKIKLDSRVFNVPFGGDCARWRECRFPHVVVTAVSG